MAKRNRGVRISRHERSKRRSAKDVDILTWWDIFEGEKGISTERLLAVVEEHTGADASRQMQALERAGRVLNKEVVR